MFFTEKEVRVQQKKEKKTSNKKIQRTVKGAAAVIEHPNQGEYPNQKIAVIVINDYAYLVPYVQVNEDIFLRTMIPSRRATKKYLGSENEKDIS